MYLDINYLEQKSKTIALYHTEALSLHFKRKVGKIFAERVFDGGEPTVQYALDFSFMKIKAIPFGFSLSRAFTIQWLLEHNYVPYIHDNKVFFRLAIAEFLLKKTVDISPKQSFPLHFSAYHGNEERVKFLLENGTDPNGIDERGCTSLHWAARGGHYTTAACLIHFGASIEIANLEDELPFDLAIRFDREDFLHFFLGTTDRLAKDSAPTDDVEGSCAKRLIEAKKQGLVEEQIVLLQKISDLYIQDQSFCMGAKILNCAFSLLQSYLDSELLTERLLSKLDEINTCMSNYDLFRAYLLSRLELIEKHFFKSICVNRFPQRSNMTLYRNWLTQARDHTKEISEQGVPVQEILKDLSQEFKKILKVLIEQSQDPLGPPPVGWACIGMGSMSRDEMCPYSDIEFAFLVEKETVEAMDYFRNLSKILELKVINLGETKFPVFETKSPTPSGFCMDSAGNTPLGVVGLYELIGTPAKLAQFQGMKWINRNIILSNAMSNVCLVAGDPQLVDSYIEEKQKVHQLDASDGLKNGELLAMRLLCDHLREFRPDLRKGRTIAFGVKKELYRPLQEILSCLAIFYDLEAKNSFGRIDELVKRNVFSEKGAENLKKALTKILSLRLQLHLFYKDEVEFLCHTEGEQFQDPSLFYMNDQHIELLSEIYQVLIPFHKCASDFYRTKDAQFLYNQDFFDDRLSIRGETFERIHQYEKAQEAFEQAISLNPGDMDALLSLGRVENKQGRAQDALKTNLKTLEIARKKVDELDCSLATIYNNSALNYHELGNYAKALELYEIALQIKLQDSREIGISTSVIYNGMGTVYRDIGNYHKAFEAYAQVLKIVRQKQQLGKNDPFVFYTLNNIGVVCSDLGKYKEALGYYEQALNLLEIFDENNRPLIAISYDNIGTVYCKRSEYKKALEHYEKSLSIKQHIFGEVHPDIAVSYNNIGSVYTELEKYEKALEYHKQALEMRVKIFGMSHPEVSLSCNNIGGVYDNLGKYKEAFEEYEKSLKIDLQLFGENHPSVASLFNNMGDVCLSLGNHDKALEFHEKALNIRLHIFGAINPSVAVSYSNIGEVYRECGGYEKMLVYCETALNIRLQIFDKPHSTIATSYDQMGTVHRKLGNYKTALEYYKKGLKIRIELFGEIHPSIAESYNNISLVYEDFGEYKKSLKYCEKSLEISLQFFPEIHPSIATYYNNIGCIYSNLGDYQKAIEFHEKALKIRLSVFGQIHPNIAESYNNYGIALSDRGEYQKALHYYKEALKIKLELFGQINPNLTISYDNIGCLYSTLGKYQKAVKYHKKSIKIKEHVFEKHHPVLATSYNNLGCVYEKLGQYETALECHHKALEIRLEKFGNTHIAVAISYNNMGGIYDQLGKFEMALEYHHKALEIKLEKLGSNHADVALSYNNLGHVYDNLGEYSQALELHNIALKIYQELFGEIHVHVAMSLRNIGSAYSGLEDNEKSLDFYKKALNIRLQILGEIHPSVGKSYTDIGLVYYKLTDGCQQAIEYLEKGLKILSLSFDKNHSEIDVSCKGIAVMYLKMMVPLFLSTPKEILQRVHVYLQELQTNFAEGSALLQLQLVHNIQKEIFGVDHLSTQKVAEILQLMNTLS